MTLITARRFGVATLVVALGAVGLEAGGQKGYTFAVVATLESSAPGGGDHINDFEPQDINARGDVIFASDLADGEGLFGWYKGTNRLIARPGDPIPGSILHLGGFGILGPGGMNDSGDVAFSFADNQVVPWSEISSTRGVVLRYDSVKRILFPVFLPDDPAPGGTTFRGAGFHVDLNNRGEIATVGIIDTTQGHCQDPAANCYGLGRGVYTFDRFNRATKIAAPGDPAPGSRSTFDDAWDANLNNAGDVIFGGHVAGEPCGGGSSSTLGCFESLYLYRASTRDVLSIVHQGDAAPSGGTFLIAFNGRLNDGGDASFIGSLENYANGVFLRTRKGTLVAVARPGDRLPGGTMKNASFTQGAHAIDNAGNVAFAAQLDADVNGDSIEDTGVYLWSGGTMTTVVRTGTVIPGLGTVVHVNRSFETGGDYPWPGVHMNERGQVLTQVKVDTGATYVVVATPK